MFAGWETRDRVTNDNFRLALPDIIACCLSIDNLDEQGCALQGITPWSDAYCLAILLAWCNGYTLV